VACHVWKKMIRHILVSPAESYFVFKCG
jgi:hypothetical protein